MWEGSDKPPPEDDYELAKWVVDRVIKISTELGIKLSLMEIYEIAKLVSQEIKKERERQKQPEEVRDKIEEAIKFWRE